MADWSALPGSAVALIARRVQLIEDFIAFRSTCSSWLKATTLKDFDKSCPRLPLLMLDQIEIDYDGEIDKNHQVDEVDENYETHSSDDNDDDYEIGQNYEMENDEINEMEDIDEMNDKDEMDEIVQRKDPEFNHQRKFLSLSKGKRCNISLPEANGMECFGSKGWLIMFERSTGNMRLFHLITRAQIPLPKAPPRVIDIRCAVLSASPSETSDYVVMAAYVEPPVHYVGFWKPGNQTWTRIETPSCVADLNYYNGKFYALTEMAQVFWMCDFSGPNPNNMASKIIELPWKSSRPSAQLVECGGRLLIVAPFFWYPSDLKSQHDLKIVELDVIKGSYNIITSLGGSTVFLGRNEGFSIDANRFTGIIEPNLIYFGDGSYRVATRGRNHVPRPSLGWGRGVWINF